MWSRVREDEGGWGLEACGLGQQRSRARWIQAPAPAASKPRQKKSLRLQPGPGSSVALMARPRPSFHGLWISRHFSPTHPLANRTNPADTMSTRPGAAHSSPFQERPSRDATSALRQTLCARRVSCRERPGERLRCRRQLTVTRGQPPGAAHSSPIQERPSQDATSARGHSLSLTGPFAKQISGRFTREAARFGAHRP